MVGIITPDNKNHRIKLKEVEEIPKAYEVICNFENVSGPKMHRNMSGTPIWET